MVETSREAHALNNTVCLLWRYGSIEVSGGFHALDGVVCIYATRFLNGHVAFHPAHSPGNSLPSIVVESAELFDSNAQNYLGDLVESSDPHGVEELASGRFLLSLLQDDQRNNIFLLCSGPLSSNNRYNGGTNIDAFRDSRSSLLVLL